MPLPSGRPGAPGGQLPVTRSPLYRDSSRRTDRRAGHGQDQQTTATRGTHVGKWHNGLRHGRGEETQPDGRWLPGTWGQDKLCLDSAFR